MKRVLITGASSGVGKHLAVAMAEKGYLVGALGRDQKRLAAARTLSKHPEAFLPILIDLIDPEQRSQAISKAESALGGPIDILVNNAGASVSGSIEDIPLAEFERIFALNTLAPIALTHQLLAAMKSRGQGKIVNVTSGVAKRALPFEAPYCLSKSALNAFTESLRVEVEGTGVQVLLFSPGPVQSGFHEARIHYGRTKLIAPPFRGRPAKEIAGLLLRAIEGDRGQVTLGLKANAMYHLNYWSPRTADKVLKKLFRLQPSES